MKMEISKLLPSINKSFQEFSKDELIKRMIVIEFSQLLNYYENSRDISSEKGERGPRLTNENQQRFFINLGHNKGLNKGGLLRLYMF